MSTLPPNDSRNLAIVSAIGLDGPGILARFTAKVAGLGANVIDLQQSLIGRYFTLVMLVDLRSANMDFAGFRDAMTREGEAVGVKVMVAEEQAFRAMHRI